LSRVGGHAWLIIVDSRFDDYVYLTSVLQLHSIIAVHTFSVFSLTSILNSWLESESESESESYVTTDGQSASLSWNKAPFWGLRPDLDYCQTVEGLLMWDVLSDERTGLSFTVAAGPRQRSHSRVRVPLNSWPYFTVSDSRLRFSSPPKTLRATMEVLTWVWVLYYDRRLVGQSVLE
jgi:hypothetical protein